MILVGEIRDLETAQIADPGVADRAHGVQHPAHQRRPAARSPGCATWASSRSSSPPRSRRILAQRLVRKICANCRTEFEPSPRSADGAEPDARADVRGKKFYYGERLRQVQQHRATRAAWASTSC